jgi:uncharacterized tellurite resistance protein B-like protein
MINILDYSNHTIKLQNIDFFVHLISVAMADGKISSSEMGLLIQIGNRIGLTDIEIGNLIQVSKHSNYIPPHEYAKRFEQVYEIVKMTMADGIIDKNEMRLASSFAAKTGFTEEEIPQLLNLLINGIRESKDHEDLFDEYKKERKNSRLKIINEGQI